MRTAPIPDYENRYDIREDGQVISVRTGKTISKRIAKNGYFIVTLWKNNKPSNKHLHRLLAEAFIENPDSLPTVNHIDGEKTNNELSNLEWASYSENNRHAYETGLKPSIKGKPQKGKQVLVSGWKTEPFMCRIAVHASQITSVPLVSVYRVLHGKRPTAHGIKFEYIEESAN